MQWHAFHRGWIAAACCRSVNDPSGRRGLPFGGLCEQARLLALAHMSIRACPLCAYLSMDLQSWVHDFSPISVFFNAHVSPPAFLHAPVSMPTRMHLRPRARPQARRSPKLACTCVHTREHDGWAIDRSIDRSSIYPSVHHPSSIHHPSIHLSIIHSSSTHHVSNTHPPSIHHPSTIHPSPIHHPSIIQNYCLCFEGRQGACRGPQINKHYLYFACTRKGYTKDLHFFCRLLLLHGQLHYLPSVVLAKHRSYFTF